MSQVEVCIIEGYALMDVIDGCYLGCDGNGTSIRELVNKVTLEAGDKHRVLRSSFGASEWSVEYNQLTGA